MLLLLTPTAIPLSLAEKFYIFFSVTLKRDFNNYFPHTRIIGHILLEIWQSSFISFDRPNYSERIYSERQKQLWTFCMVKMTFMHMKMRNIKFLYRSNYWEKHLLKTLIFRMNKNLEQHYSRWLIQTSQCDSLMIKYRDERFNHFWYIEIQRDDLIFNLFFSFHRINALQKWLFNYCMYLYLNNSIYCKLLFLFFLFSYFCQV